MTSRKNDDVELSGLEPLTPCLQIVVITRVEAAELHSRLPVSHPDVPLVTVLNGMLMARDLGRGRAS
jgi:hypothetical protein